LELGKVHSSVLSSTLDEEEECEVGSSLGAAFVGFVLDCPSSSADYDSDSESETRDENAVQIDH